MGLAELLKTMDAAGVSLVQMQRYKPTTGKFYAATVGWFVSGAWRSSCANGPTQEAALEAAMRSTGLFEEFPVIRIEAPAPRKRQRSLEDIL